MKKSLQLTLLLVLGLLFAQEATAQRMITFQRPLDSETSPTVMNDTDPTTGVGSLIGSTGVGAVTAATFDPTTGMLYASHGGGGCCPVPGVAGCLLMGNTTTGAIINVGCDSVYGGNDNMPGLACDSSGNLFGALLADNSGLNDGNIHLVRINKSTGAISVVGIISNWNSGQGMAFAGNDTLYSQNLSDGFGWVDTTSGTFTAIGYTTTGFPSGSWDRVTDMAYDYRNGIMYASVSDGGGGSPTALATVNVATGEFTYVATFPDYTNSLAINSLEIITFVNDTTCDTYSFGGMTLDESGTYIDTLTAVGGEDSIVKLNLLVVAENEVSVMGANLSTNISGAMYQWYDCDADTNLTGDTMQSFQPMRDGNFAVITSIGGCVDTSECVSFDYRFEPNRMISFRRWDTGETEPTVMHYTDPFTAEVFPIDSTGVGQITAAAFDPTTGKLYASHGGGGCCPVSGFGACVLVGDTATGEVTVQGCDSIYGGNDNMAGIGFDSKGNMWGILLASNTNPANDTMYLVSVDKVTGTITLRGSGVADWGGARGNGMAFGPDDVIYYSNSSDGFGTIDTTTGTFTYVGFSQIGFPDGNWTYVTDMTYDFLNDVMYAAVTDEDFATANQTALATVNLETGEFTFVDTFPNYINSIAVTPAVVTEMTAEACGSYDFAGMTLTESGVYGDTLKTVVNGIDSLVRLTLTIFNTDPSVTVMGDTLMAAQDGATYQWIDCDAGNAPVAGATDQMYVATESGNYAVIITNGPCLDTSACSPVVGLNPSHPLKAFQVFPNPANDELFLSLPTAVRSPRVTLYNTLGKVVASPSADAVAEGRIDLGNVAPGIYLIELTDGDRKISRRFVKK